MRRFSDVSWGTFFDLPNPSLSRWFGGVRNGQPREYRTTLFKGMSLEDVLKGWDAHAQKIATEWPSLYDFEMDMRKKVGPLSIQAPLSKRMDDIEAYYADIGMPAVPVSQIAHDALMQEYHHVRDGVRIRPQDQTWLKMKKTTNSGSPFFSPKKLVLKDTYPAFCWQEDETTVQVLGPKRRTWNACAVLGWRGQEGGPKPSDVKQRVVWMFPFSVNLRELQFYQPAIEAFQKRNLVPAWNGNEAVDLAITRLFDTKRPGDLVVCTDFTKFDQHINPTCQKEVYEILYDLLAEDPASEIWLREVFPIKYNIPLAYDWGKIRFGVHGMGSGSGGTNFDETMLHRLLQHEAALSNGAVLNLNSMCLGDDGILSYPGIQVEDVVRCYTQHGLEMNESKQYASTDDCVYLRRWHSTHYRVDDVCVGVYSTYRALGKLLEQERYYSPRIWSAKTVALRQISILENVKWHPLGEEFVRYCMKGDKYRLGIDIPGFLEQVGKMTLEDLAPISDSLSYITQERLRLSNAIGGGLADYWIVKLLKKIAAE